MKGKSILALALASVLTLSTACTNTSFVLQTRAEEQENRLENVRGEDGYVTCMFTNEEYTIGLNLDGLEDVTEVQWIVNFYHEGQDVYDPERLEELTDVPVEELYSIDTEGHSITLYGEGLSKVRHLMRDGGCWFDLVAEVYYGQEELFQQILSIELCEPEMHYHYHHWGESLLPYWDISVEKYINYYVRNSEYPYGYEDWVEISNIEIELLEGSDDTLIMYEWDDGNGWNLYTEDYGHAVVTLTHEDVLNPEEDLQHSFDVWVGQDVWNAHISSAYGESEVIPGGSMELTANVSHECYTEEEGHFRGDTKQVAYVWGYAEGANEELLDFEADKNVLHVTADENAENNQETAICVRGYLTDKGGKILKDEEGNEIELFYTDFRIYVRDGYFRILPFELEETIELGDTLEITPKVQYVSLDGVEESTENIVYNWEWDSNVFEIFDSEGNKLEIEGHGRSDLGTGTYEIRRIAPWETGLNLYAYIEEDGEFHEIAGRNYNIPWNSYDVWFENVRFDEWNTFVFMTEDDYTVQLNTDSLRDENGNLKDNISIEWSVGYTNKDQEIIGELKEGEEYFLSEDGTEIHLNGQKMYENEHMDRNMIEVTVKSNGVNTTEEPLRLHFWVREEYMELQDDYDSDILLMEGAGWGYEPEGIWVYVESPLYPEGAAGFCEILDIEVRSIDEHEEDIFEVYKNRDGSWFIEALRYGGGQIEYTLYEESLGEFTVVRDRWVSDQIYRMETYTDTRIWEMFPNTEMTIFHDIYQMRVDEHGNYEKMILPADRYELKYDYYDQNVITIDENGRVTSHGEFGETELSVSVEIEMLNGEDIYYLHENNHIWVTDYILMLCGENTTVEYDAEISVDELGIRMVERTWGDSEDMEYELDEIEIIPAEWLEISEDGKSFVILQDALGEELPAVRELFFIGRYEGWEFYNCIELTIVEDIPKESVSEVFRDISEGKWYVDAVQYVYDNGLMAGSNGLFNPVKDVTRAQLVTTLYRLAGEPKVTNYQALEAFSDVAAEQYYTDPICWAYNVGVGTGNNGRFDVAGKLTRQQMAAFLYRFASVMGYDTDQRSDYSSMLNADKVSSYAEEAVSWAVGAGLISGSEKTNPDGSKVYDLNPRGNTTRAQLAAILQRFCE